MEETGVDWYGSEQEQVEGSCESSSELSISIKCGEFIDR